MKRGSLSGLRAPALDPGELLHIGASQHMDFGAWVGEVRRRARAVRLSGTTVVARSLGRYSIFLDADDVGFATHIIMDGFWEPWIARFLVSRIKPGMVVVDVGANYGYYTLIMADLVGATGKVHAFEPNPEVLQQLDKTVAVNGFERIVTLYNEAVVDADGEMRTLAVPKGEPKNGFIASARHGAGSLASFEVPVCTLDRRLASCERVDFVKVDAEGAEELIVKGMDGLLMRHKPDLLLEFNRARGVDPMGMVLRLNTIYGQNPLHVSDEGALAPVTAEDLNGRRGGHDWMLFYSMRR